MGLLGRPGQHGREAVPGRFRQALGLEPPSYPPLMAGRGHGARRRLRCWYPTETPEQRPTGGRGMRMRGCSWHRRRPDTPRTGKLRAPGDNPLRTFVVAAMCRYGPSWRRPSAARAAVRLAVVRLFWQAPRGPAAGRLELDLISLAQTRCLTRGATTSWLWKRQTLGCGLRSLSGGLATWDRSVDIGTGRSLATSACSQRPSVPRTCTLRHSDTPPHLLGPH